MDMNTNKSNKLIKKLNGYQKANRERFLLLTFGELTLGEFVLYEFCITITDWDSRHYETYGTFKETNQQIAQMLDWKDGSTVSRYKKSLIEKGILELEGDRLRVKDFEKRELRKK